jgi:hypothetical protein
VDVVARHEVVSMSLCQICHAEMVKENVQTPTGTATLVVCSDWRLHPVAFIGGNASGVPKGSAAGVAR